jgi:hypothetical protein
MGRREGWGIFIVAAKQEVQDGRPRARGGLPTQQVSPSSYISSSSPAVRKWESRCCHRRYELCCCHWRGESCCCHWRTESCSDPCCHCLNQSPRGEGEGPIRHHPKYHSWGDYDLIVGGGDDDSGGRGGRAHKENIES